MLYSKPALIQHPAHTQQWCEGCGSTHAISHPVMPGWKPSILCPKCLAEERVWNVKFEAAQADLLAMAAPLVDAWAAKWNHIFRSTELGSVIEGLSQLAQKYNHQPSAEQGGN